MVCTWLGIHNVSAKSAIGLMGDDNWGCQSAVDAATTVTGLTYHDDLAIGVGLNSCQDSNGCEHGGSNNEAGMTRNADGADGSGVYGPWFVFGR